MDYTRREFIGMVSAAAALTGVACGAEESGGSADALTGDEVERLVPMVRRQYQVSEELAALDLGGLDPRGTQYITDRRLTP